MPSIWVDIRDMLDELSDEDLLREVKQRDLNHLLHMDKDVLLSLARRDPYEALLEIERELGHHFDGLLTRGVSQ